MLNRASMLIDAAIDGQGIALARTTLAAWDLINDISGPVGSADDKSYQAAPRLVLFWAIEALRIDPADYNFMDYGSGRGRILLTAARLPFQDCRRRVFPQPP